MDWQSECERLKAENEQLKMENILLKKRLGVDRDDSTLLTTNHQPLCTTIHMHSTPDEKIALLRSLFHGREDAYAKRWYSEKLHKGGYAPTHL